MPTPADIFAATAAACHPAFPPALRAAAQAAAPALLARMRPQGITIATAATILDAVFRSGEPTLVAGMHAWLDAHAPTLTAAFATERERQRHSRGGALALPLEPQWGGPADAEAGRLWRRVADHPGDSAFKTISAALGSATTATERTAFNRLIQSILLGEEGWEANPTTTNDPVVWVLRSRMNAHQTLLDTPTLVALDARLAAAHPAHWMEAYTPSYAAIGAMRMAAPAPVLIQALAKKGIPGRATVSLHDATAIIARLPTPEALAQMPPERAAGCIKRAVKGTPDRGKRAGPEAADTPEAAMKRSERARKKAAQG